MIFLSIFYEILCYLQQYYYNTIHIVYYDWSSSFSWQQNEIQKYYGNQQVNEQI